MADSTQPSEQSNQGTAGKAKKSTYSREYYAQNRERILAQNKEYRQRNRDAKRERDRKYYAKNKEKIAAQVKVYRALNRKSISDKKKARYQANKEEIKAKERARRQKDPERYRAHHRAQQKVWRAENGDRVRAIYRRYMNKKRRTDPLFWLKCTTRERICGALSRVSSRKSNKTLDLIGCTVAELARHLESKFLPGMTWENRGAGGWHVDHIIPLAKFDLSDPVQQAAAFHYTNLQPLWARDNIRKHANAPGQNLFGFAYAAKIADAASAKPKRRRGHARKHGSD